MEMAIYYIDSTNGSNENDGLSKGQPLLNDKSLRPLPGDKILFKRGSFIRGMLNNISGSEGMPVTYGAYGEGEPPVFCGSVDLTDAGLWHEEEKNIWSCDAVKNDEVGNFVFDNYEAYGTLRWTKDDLKEQGDFYDECFGYSENKKTVPEKHKVYLYSKINPALIYTSIECVTFNARRLANSGHDIIFENLRFINSGVHAIAGESKSRNIKVLNCEFENIGGCVWNYDLKIRFGNGVEFWDVAENIEINGCYFNNIYDSAVTHQGMENCKPAENFIITDNVFKKCGMAAYEQRDKLPLYAVFNNNICIDAGEGFSKQGEVMPRRSEIWPQPMGHHVFLWRIEDKTAGGKLEIKNNIFYNAPYGAAIYSIISENAEEQIEIEGNTYYTDNPNLINRWHCRNYRTFADYCIEEKKAEYKKSDVNVLVLKLKKGCYKTDNRVGV